VKGDALASPHLISPETYRRFALEPERQLIREVQEYGIPLSMHICGNTKSIFREMLGSGGAILEIDALIEMSEARAACLTVPPAERPVLLGNMNTSHPQNNWGWALWCFRGSFGILDSGRGDVSYENFHGHPLDREMLTLLQGG
jgi:hypothetical protein